jgi:hypothetical protein
MIQVLNFCFTDKMISSTKYYKPIAHVLTHMEADLATEDELKVNKFKVLYLSNLYMCSCLICKCVHVCAVNVFMYYL